MSNSRTPFDDENFDERVQHEGEPEVLTDEDVAEREQAIQDAVRDAARDAEESRQLERNCSPKRVLTMTAPQAVVLRRLLLAILDRRVDKVDQSVMTEAMALKLFDTMQAMYGYSPYSAFAREKAGHRKPRPPSEDASVRARRWLELDGHPKGCVCFGCAHIEPLAAELEAHAAEALKKYKNER